MLHQSSESSSILGIIALVFCYGLWQLKAWVKTSTLFLSVFGLISGGGSNAISILFAGVMIDYLLQPEVKLAFGK
ncbi:hypothetical protein [Microcoleus sp. FACHB-68]|uniref:hypothetical protein n=1 Tax=Microcoleus sp. FACHB-68 TaxID=2692826 RepID=UPI001686D161|nr:hypothetical protein [Microcoleus sp. FACHB-68]MBD1936313.1 hypothetical protein [Microcoleus sp. FACHB-68]